ncbi:MAG: ParB N-terminal domain-containing protein [Coriobacteriia bacterium]|nr:ParB N-terminal domain-containing protein [Coriobacteriia bacterium]
MSTFQLFAPLDAATEAALRASITRFGVLVPVAVDQDGNILDGHHRVRLANELGVEYRVDTFTVADEAEAREIARTLNADRRQLDREQRREVVATLWREGHSQRAIAGALGAGQSTVYRDLQMIGDSHESPARVTGTDGKSYPAIRKNPCRDDVIAPTETPAPRRIQKVGRHIAQQEVFDRSIHELTIAASMFAKIDALSVTPSPEQLKELTEAIRVFVRIRKALTTRGDESHDAA